MEKIKTLLTSKRFISTLVVLVFIVISTFWAQLQPLEDFLVENALWIILSLVAGYSVTDVASLWLGQPGNVGRAGVLFAAVIDEFERKTGKDIDDSLEMIARQFVEQALASVAKPSETPQEIG